MAMYKKSEITKEKITMTAARLFAEKGYKNTTIREICTESGVSQSRVNYHFTGKKELASEIFSGTLENIDKVIASIYTPQREGALNYAACYIRYWLSAFLSEDKYVRFCADLADEGVFLFPIHKVFSKIFRSVNSEEKIGLSHDEEFTHTAVFVAALNSMIKLKHNGQLTRSNQDFCDLFVELFLKLNYVPRERIAEIVAYSRARVEEEGLTDHPRDTEK